MSTIGETPLGAIPQHLLIVFMSANNYTAVKGKHFVQGQDSGSSGKSDFYANSYLGLILLSFNDLTGTCEFNKCFLVPPSTTISSHYRKKEY